MKKAFFAIVGFGLGAFMLLNGAVAYYRATTDATWVLTTTEKFVSAGITGLVGIVLIAWTSVIIKKKKY